MPTKNHESPPKLLMFLISIPRIGSGKSRAACVGCKWETGFGTQIVPSNIFLHAHHYFMLGRFHQSADIRSSPTCGPHMMRSQRTRSVSLLDWLPNMHCRTHGRGSVFAISPRRNRKTCHQYPKLWCARFLKMDENLSTSLRML